MKRIVAIVLVLLFANTTIFAEIFYVDLSDSSNIVLPPCVYAPIFQSSTSPVTDGIDLAVPSVLGNVDLAEIGYVDVTAAPFYADASGNEDSTEALQNAIDFARDNQMVTFFPTGTYLISDTLYLRHGLYLRTNRANILNAQNYSCMLLGSIGEDNPKIVLKDNTEGFDNSSEPKPVIKHFTYLPTRNASTQIITINTEIEQGNSLFNGSIINLDIDTGSGNSGAIGIYSNSAEGSVIQNVAVDASGSYACFFGAAGNGGSWAKIKGVGGEYGAIFPPLITIPGPVVVGAEFNNQTGAAIKFESRGSLTLVGLKIYSSATTPVIVQGDPWNPFDSTLNMVDCQIEFEHDGILFSNPINKSVYLNNVYIKNAETVFTDALAGNKEGWLKVAEFALGKNKNFSSVLFSAPTYADGEKMPSYSRVVNGIAPPHDLNGSHLWNEMPTFETVGAVNVKRDYNVKGDGIYDDTTALQQAINENEYVFLPKGYYRVTQTLQLKSNTKLIGVAAHLSTIYVRNPDNSGWFSDVDNPKPIVQTASDAEADTIIAFCGIRTPYEVPTTYNRATLPMYTVDWQCGPNSIVNTVDFNPLRVYGFTIGNQYKYVDYSSSVVQVSNNGGGKWYNFHHSLPYIPMKNNGRILSIKNTRYPLAFYSLEPQCIKGSHDPVQSGENPVTIEADNVKFLSIFGAKTEGNSIFLKAVNSDHIRVFGHSGLGTGCLGGSLYDISNTANFLIANISDQIYMQSDYSTYANNFIRYRYDDYYPICDNGTFIPVDERPVLYKRGNAAGSEEIGIYSGLRKIIDIAELNINEVISAETSYKDKGGIIMIAVYEGERMLDISYASTANEQKAEITLAYESLINIRVKAFLWSGFDTLVPVFYEEL